MYSTIMEQLHLFGEGRQSSGLPPELLEYYPHFFDADTSRKLLDRLIHTTPWEQRGHHVWKEDPYATAYSLVRG